MLSVIGWLKRKILWTDWILVMNFYKKKTKFDHDTLRASSGSPRCPALFLYIENTKLPLHTDLYEVFWILSLAYLTFKLARWRLPLTKSVFKAIYLARKKYKTVAVVSTLARNGWDRITYEFNAFFWFSLQEKGRLDLLERGHKRRVFTKNQLNIWTFSSNFTRIYHIKAKTYLLLWGSPMCKTTNSRLHKLQKWVMIQIVRNDEPVQILRESALRPKHT